MADKTARVRILRNVQGPADDPVTGKEILVAGSVVDLLDSFAGELVGSNAAERVESDEKLIKLPLHPVDKSSK